MDPTSVEMDTVETVVAVVLDSTNIGQAKAHIAAALACNAAGRTA